MLVGWIALLGAVGVSLSLAALLAAMVNQRITRLIAAEPAGSAAAGAANPDALPLTGSSLDRH
jgi:hypothetical protein